MTDQRIVDIGRNPRSQGRRITVLHDSSVSFRLDGGKRMLRSRLALPEIKLTQRLVISRRIETR